MGVSEEEEREEGVGGNEEYRVELVETGGESWKMMRTEMETLGCFGRGGGEMERVGGRVGGHRAKRGGGVLGGGFGGGCGGV